MFICAEEGDGDYWSPLTRSHGFQFRVSFHSPVAIGRLVPPTHDLLGSDWAVIVLLQRERKNCSKVSFVPLAAGVSLLFSLVGFSEFCQAPLDISHIDLQNDWCRTLHHSRLT